MASGFNSPQGVLVAPDGSVWVIDSGVGGEEDVPFVSVEMTGTPLVAAVAAAAPETMPVTGDTPPDPAWVVVATGAVVLAAGLFLGRGLDTIRARRD